MKQPRTPLRWPVLSALVLSAALAACSKQPDDELAAGQRMDQPVVDATQDANRRADQQATVDSTAQATADMAITAKVNAALVADDELKATQINVDTRDGSVTLSGKAPDANARERATMLASAVTGVKQVNNQLAIAG